MRLVLLLSCICLPAGAGCSPEDGNDPVAAGEASPRDAFRAASDAPNIILLTVESIRADHVGCYGYERETTPSLDALAQEGVVFENANAVTSWTLTSHASIFTGLYPSAHQVVRPNDQLGEGYRTLAEELAEAGYQTAAVVSGPYLRTKHNLNQGFAHYDASPITPPKASASKDITNPRMESSMERFLREQRDAQKPFFLFGYYWDPHSLYIPPPPYDTMFVPDDAEPIAPGKVLYMPAFKLGQHISPAQLRHLVAQYDGEIRCTDDYLGRLWNLLHELGLWDNTAIIVTADHGEEFYEHGHNSHKNTLYVESVHVPLIFKPPAGGPRGVRDERIVNLVDLYPTVLELAGLEPRVPHNGRSLLDPPVDGRPTFYELQTLWTFTQKSTGERWQESDIWTAVRKGPYKLIHVRNVMNRARTAVPDRWELYDCVSDPAELHPLGQGYEEVVGDLQGELDSWKDAMEILARRWTPGGAAQLSKEEEHHLRSLGYLP